MKAIIQSRSAEQQNVGSYRYPEYIGPWTETVTLVASDENRNEFNIEYKGSQAFPANIMDVDVDVEIKFTFTPKVKSSVVREFK